MAQMIYQQPNPQVHYEYILPSENSVSTTTNTEEGELTITLSNNN